MTLPPPLASLASDSPKVDGSPLKNVVLPSPTEAKAPESKTLESLRDVGQPMDVETGSTVAEPPSTIVGEEPEAAQNRDLELAPTTAEALLPPPPDQVGNIATPKADDASSRVSDNDDKPKDSEPMSSIDKSAFQHQDSIMTEDSIKPEDSASVRFPLTESGAPSEVGTASVDETKEPAAAPTSTLADNQPPHEPTPVAEEPAPTAKPNTPPAAEEPKAEPVESAPAGLTVPTPPPAKEPTPPTVAAPEPETQETEAAPSAAPSLVPESVAAPPAEPSPEAQPEVKPEPEEQSAPAEPVAAPVAEPADDKPDDTTTAKPEEPVAAAVEEPQSAAPEPAADAAPASTEAPTEEKKEDETAA